MDDAMAGPQKTLIDRLPEVVEAACLLPLVEKLRAGACSLRLEASRVRTLHAGALEGLLVIARTQRARGDAVVLENPSEDVLSVLALHGLALSDVTSPAEDTRP
ncbi:MAG: hypothetical protein AAFP13_01140 [Pseudomonadota bacterium]